MAGTTMAPGSDWENDMQYRSMAQDRKTEAEGNFAQYLADHPEIRAICADFVKHLLIFKPDDVLGEAGSYFEQFVTEKGAAAAPAQAAETTPPSADHDDSVEKAMTSIGPVFSGTAGVAVYHVYGDSKEESQSPMHSIGPVYSGTASVGVHHVYQQ